MVACFRWPVANGLKGYSRFESVRDGGNGPLWVSEPQVNYAGQSGFIKSIIIAQNSVRCSQEG